MGLRRGLRCLVCARIECFPVSPRASLGFWSARLAVFATIGNVAYRLEFTGWASASAGVLSVTLPDTLRRPSHGPIKGSEKF